MAKFNGIEFLSDYLKLATPILAFLDYLIPPLISNIAKRDS